MSTSLLAKIVKEAERLRIAYEQRELLAGQHAVFVGHTPPVQVRITRLHRQQVKIVRDDDQRFAIAGSSRRRIWVRKDLLQPITTHATQPD